MRRYGVVILALVATVGIGACDEDDDDDDDSNSYTALLNGQNERPAVQTGATGTFTLTDNGAQMSFILTVNNITGPITGAHIHAVPRSGIAASDTTGGIVVDLAPPNANVTNGVLAQGTFTQANIRGLSNQPPISMDSLRTLINAGRTYVNVHTQANLGGHIRGTIVRQ